MTQSQANHTVVYVSLVSYVLSAFKTNSMKRDSEHEIVNILNISFHFRHFGQPFHHSKYT